MPAATKSASAAPERSLAQRMEALSEANRIRTERARLKRKLKDGGANIAVLLRDPPDYILTAKVSDMLLAVLHKYGIEEIPKYDSAGRAIGVQKNFGSSTAPISL